MLNFIFKCSVGKLELKQVLNFQKAQFPSIDTTFVKMVSILFSVAEKDSEIKFSAPKDD